MRDPMIEAAVIDLDEAEDEPVRESVAARWRRKVSATTVLLMVLSAVVGAVAAQRWDAVRLQGRQAGEVSLFVTVAGMDVGGGDGRKLTIEGAVAVLNAGPGPVLVSGAGVVADVMVWGEHRIDPGATGRFPVSATFACADDGAASRPLPVGLSAVPADGVRRTVTAAMEMSGSSWHELVTRVCGQLQRQSDGGGR